MFRASVIITSATQMLCVAFAEADEPSLNYRICFILFFMQAKHGPVKVRENPSVGASL